MYVFSIIGMFFRLLIQKENIMATIRSVTTEDGYKTETEYRTEQFL